tara:strand:+ start:1051 stop:1626 length:576 start_codon:yes stop_codon:yes gene_type:complete
MKKKLRFAILYGSTRRKRLGIRLVRYLHDQISKNKYIPYIVDPLQYKLPLLDKRFDDFDKKKVPVAVKNIQNILDKADAFILVSAEYNHMPPPALINLLNYYYKEFDRKPSCICTYSVGDFAGVRVQSPLRSLMSQLGSPPIKYGMYQPKLSKNFNEIGIPHNSKDAEERFNIFFKELVWYASILKGKKKI